ncbi:hypothetical protein LAZ67_18002655, partial [Cordylochernes scorpioides]
MSLRKILADDLKWRAVGRMEAGQSQVEVAKWLNVNKSVVSKIWKQFIETGTIKRKEGSGRKIKTATSEDRYLVVTAKRHREMTAIQLSNELSSATGTRISRQTVDRRLHEGALYARRPMVCIPLTSAHRRARLNWCLELHAWTHDQWANVLFSDESRFSLNTDSRRVFIWREPGTRYHPSNIREIDSFRGGSLLVWAGISSSRRTPLHIFSGGTLTAQRYRDEILEPYLRPSRVQIGHNLIFMDDNARPHRARLVNEYLQSENIRWMDWPARSPDLNPIEHVWDALGRRIGARHPSPRTLVELRTALLEEWGLLPLDLLQSLKPMFYGLGWNLLGRSHSTPYFRQGTLTGQRYRDEILAAYVMPQALEMGENFLLMDDNARPHRAGVVDTFLQNHAIARMNWPARSPDLNPIEHVWDNLGRQISSLQPPPRNTHELETALTQ